MMFDKTCIANFEVVLHHSLICSFIVFRFQSVGDALLHTLQNHLGNKFTPNVLEAWTAVYELLAKNRDEQVTEEQISLVQETWGLVNDDLEQLGVEFYVR